MKNIFLIIILFCLPFILFSQIPNAGFENWTSMGSYNNPDQWGTMNDKTAPANAFTCTKGTPGNPGSAYIKLTSRPVTGMGIVPGIAVSGVLNTTTLKPVSGFAYTSRPESFKGNWQFMAYGSDQGYIYLFLSHWNSGLQHRDTIAYAYKPLPGMVMSWAAFTIPLVYKSGAYPDSAVIMVSASNANGAVTSANSYVYLDNLSFFGTVAGVEQPDLQELISVFPNPANEKLFISVPPSVRFPVSLTVISNSGRQVLSNYSLDSATTLSLDISNLTSGIYMIRMTFGNTTVTRKFIRN